MAPIREGLFPSISIGRTGSSQLQHVASHESLNAHPLLSPNPPSSLPSTQGPSPEGSSSAPRYVPYTPRHRPPTSSATTGMTTQASMPVASHQHQQGGATSKLQLQNLKAAAQGIGLGSGTVGWAILEKLVDGEIGPEWDEIWTIITTAKPTLLLPTEPYSNEDITPSFVKDHIAFCNGSSPSPIVTLSGLRGSINNGTLTIQSTLPIASKLFSDILKPDTQSATLMLLPPLPSTFVPNTPDTFPSFSVPGSTSLPLPPRSYPPKPPLPPRPGTSLQTPPKPASVARISNPFASLFGRPPPSSVNPSPSPSQISLVSEEAHSATGLGVEVPALSVDKKIVTKIIRKALSRLTKENIKKGLARCPTWVVEQVIDFTGPLHPIPRPPKLIDIRRASSSFRAAGSSRQLPSVLSPSTHPSSDPSVLSEAFQTFYALLEEDLRGGSSGSPLLGRRKEDQRSNYSQDDSNTPEPSISKNSVENERPDPNDKDSESRIREILEQVECVICCTFYDRTFCPPSGDDASHDDALASRIAALNMLDLGLEHLGVEIPNEAIKRDVHNVVKTCGEILQRLEDIDHRSPKRKSSLLVEAHKEIVDGLSRLPKLLLKPEREFEERDTKTPMALTFGKQAAQEVTNESPSPPAEMVSMVSETTKEGEDMMVENGPLVSSPVAINPLIVPPSDFDLPGSTRSTDLPSDQLESQPYAIDVPSGSSPPSLSDSSTHDSRATTPTTVSGDLLLPLLIFSVVKANPARLVSHLLYTQRFRSRSTGGQESYCLINLMAVVEFLEHVDMSALGLGDSERVMSTADLSPIPLARGPIDSGAISSSPFSTRLGQRVNQQVEELAGLAGSANKVITGVVDSSFGVLRGFLTSNPDLSAPPNEEQDTAPWNAMRPGFGLLRRGSGFSIASVAASLPGAGRPKTPGGDAGEEGQQLVEVSSRPGSIKEVELEDDEDSSLSDIANEDDLPDRGDARSVRSFSSMMSRESRDRGDGKERLSLTDRLANVSARTKSTTSPNEQHGSKASPPSSRPTSRPSSWLPPPSIQPDTPALISPGPPKVRMPPPNRRFLECAEQDIRVGEVGELLREYRRMVQALRLAGAFDDQSLQT